MKEVHATYQSKAPLRKPKSLESHGVEQVGGVCEGRSGPAFPPEPSTISPVPPPHTNETLSSPLSPTAAEMSLFRTVSACRTQLCREAQPTVTVPLAANVGSEDAARQPRLLASLGVFLFY